MNKVRFLKAKNGQKKDGSGPYYIVSLLVEGEEIKFFPTAEHYKNITEKKPEYLKEYYATFESILKFGKLVPELVSLNDIK